MRKVLIMSIKFSIVGGILAAALLGLSACMSPSPAQRHAASADSQMVFIDIDSFDERFIEAMEASQNNITVKFTGNSVTTNEIPERVQKWLSAADTTGEGLKISSTDGTQSKDIFALLSLIPRGYELIRDSYHQLLISNYGATVFVDNRDASIDQIIFSRSFSEK
jgi:hypothetical protein